MKVNDEKSQNQSQIPDPEPDPDPLVRVADPEHWSLVYV